MPASVGHAMVTPGERQGGHPVPVLLLQGNQESETSARVLYLGVRAGRLRLRFQLECPISPAEPVLELTFVTEESKPLFTAPAKLAVEREYRVDVALPPILAATWANLKVTDRMPFRFILGVPDTRG